MDQPTSTVVAAVVALIGVLAGLAVGLRRWQGERRDARTADFAKDRRAAYQNLWSNVEGLSIALRTERLTRDELDGRVRELNAGLLKSGLFIDEPDRESAASYVEAVKRFHALVSSSNDPEAQRSFSLTDAIPAEVIQRARDLGVAQERARDLRGRLVQRLRVVLNDEKDS
jgi:hypothetical protein